MEDKADGRSMYDIFADLEIEEQEEEATTVLASSPGQEEGGTGGETAISAETLSPTSLLSSKEIDRLLGLDEPLPVAFLKQNAGKMHSTDAIVDFATTVCIDLAQGNLKARESSEMRRWAELMYTCVLAGEGGAQNTQVNYVGQLIQLAGVAPVEEASLGQPSKQVIKVQDAILDGTTTRQKKSQGE